MQPVDRSSTPLHVVGGPLCATPTGIPAPHPPGTPACPSIRASVFGIPGPQPLGMPAWPHVMPPATTRATRQMPIVAAIAAKRMRMGYPLRFQDCGGDGYLIQEGIPEGKPRAIIGLSLGAQKSGSVGIGTAHKLKLRLSKLTQELFWETRGLLHGSLLCWRCQFAGGKMKRPLSKAYEVPRSSIRRERERRRALTAILVVQHLVEQWQKVLGVVSEQLIANFPAPEPIPFIFRRHIAEQTKPQKTRAFSVRKRKPKIRKTSANTNKPLP